MSSDTNERKSSKIPIIKAESETQTTSHLVVLPHEKSKSNKMEEPQQSQNINTIRKKRNLSKNRGQATRQREKTPEPGRTLGPHEDTTTSDDEDPKTPRSHREVEADKTYQEMKRLVQEKTNIKDPEYDLDIEEVREARAYAETEKRRRSISPFALPDKEELAHLRRKGSFIDPSNKLLSTTYTLSPKDEDLNRRSSLTIDTTTIRRNSLSPPTPTSSSPRDNTGFTYPSPTSPRKQMEMIYPDEKLNKKSTKAETITGTSIEQNDTKLKQMTKAQGADKTPESDTKELVTKVVQVERTPSKKFNQGDKSQTKQKTATARTSEIDSGELVTKVIQVERTSSKKLNQEDKPAVEIKQRVVRTSSGKSNQESKPFLGKQSPKPIQKQEEQQLKLPPVKPARSKSASRFGGKTSESEMSEDQANANKETLLKPSKRKTIATPRRFIKDKSPRAKRSQSVTRVEDLLDKTGTGMSQTSREIIELLQKARARSLSIPKDDIRTPLEYQQDIRQRLLITPNKTPESRRTRGISCPKTIQIISDKEILASLTKAKHVHLETDRSRKSSGYIDASQSEYTSSCYSTSPSENEYDFDLSERTDELTRKLSLLSFEMASQEALNINNSYYQTDTVSTKPILRKRSLVDSKKETKKEKNKIKDEKKPKSQAVDTGTPRFNIIPWRRDWLKFKIEQKREYEAIKLLMSTCFCDVLLLIFFCGLGGMIFKTLEGSFENAYKCGTRSVKRDFLEQLWKGSHYLREEDWKSMARKKLFEFENQLHTAHESGVTSYSGQKSWNFMNSFVYCLTVVTTIGYGHIAPSTLYGRVATIVYAVIGIPLFLIVLADFGKLLTRIIKFLWAFVRRVYYTGSCKKVRRTVHVQDVMKGLNIMYDAVRRPSQMIFEEDLKNIRPEGAPPIQPRSDGDTPPPLPPKSLVAPNVNPDVETGTEPDTPAPSVFEIDDEFNLPISVAIVILIGYIFVGAAAYASWEDWTFFESFYFVFISMSTIGFGDFVPNHPMFMMASILYLVFGLALTSMCINVVQVKLSDTFKQASAKLGATIGLRVADDDVGLVPITPQPSDLAPVHRPKREVNENPEIPKEQ